MGRRIAIRPSSDRVAQRPPVSGVAGDRSSHDDLRLLRRVAAGDRGAIDAFVRSYADALWRFARSTVGDDHTAEEITQDTMAAAIRGATRFRGDSSVRTWVFAICRRQCAGHLRRRTVALTSLDEATAETIGALDGDPTTAHALREAMGRLSDDHRDAFVLISVLGYRRVEAAALLGIPASTMRSRHDAARRSMAEYLSEVL